MQIRIDSPPFTGLSSDPNFSRLEGYMNLLINRLMYAQGVPSVNQWLYEHQFMLTETAWIIRQVYAGLKNITDPTILNSPEYKTLMADLTSKTDPSLIAAAEEGDMTDLAELLVEMNNAGSGQFSITDLETALNSFLYAFPA